MKTENKDDYSNAISKFLGELRVATDVAAGLLTSGEIIGCLEITKARLIDDIMRAHSQHRMQKIIDGTRQFRSPENNGADGMPLNGDGNKPGEKP